jgi:uncharacterized tellurite resistance protein B-like protein
MKHYLIDSPEAQARLLALMLLADGDMARRELESLERERAFERIGLSRGQFLEVMNDFCDDLIAHAPLDKLGAISLDNALMDRLLADVASRARQREMCALMFAVLKADKRLSPGESLLFWRALDRWRVSLEEVKRRVMPVESKARLPRVFRRTPRRVIPQGVMAT